MVCFGGSSSQRAHPKHFTTRGELVAAPGCSHQQFFVGCRRIMGQFFENQTETQNAKVQHDTNQQKKPTPYPVVVISGPVDPTFGAGIRPQRWRRHWDFFQDEQHALEVPTSRFENRSYFYEIFCKPEIGKQFFWFVHLFLTLFSFCNLIKFAFIYQIKVGRHK